MGQGTGNSLCRWWCIRSDLQVLGRVKKIPAGIKYSPEDSKIATPGELHLITID